MNLEKKFSNQQISAAKSVLETLASNAMGVTGIVLTSSDGFELASYNIAPEKTGKLAAMGSSLQALSDALAREGGLRNTKSVMVEVENGHILMTKVPASSPPLTLALFANESAIVGKLLWEVKNACIELALAINEAKE
jgi:uncharacterized protein